MSAPLFSFVQLEFPRELGPADGRYPLRDKPGGDATHIVVLATLGAAQRRLLAARRTRTHALPDPTPVATARVTVIDPQPRDEDAARRRLAELAPQEAAAGAVAVVNRVLYAHRLATADPTVHEVGAHQALVVRAGFGSGEQVADGQWLEAATLHLPRERHSRRRSSALRPQERLSALLSARNPALLGEELLLRARLDLDNGRPRHAALELEQAYLILLHELRAEHRADLRDRLQELADLAAGVKAAAASARSGADPDVEALEHALARAEAALRARAARGFAEDGQ